MQHISLKSQKIYMLISCVEAKFYDISISISLPLSLFFFFSFPLSHTCVLLLLLQVPQTTRHHQLLRGVHGPGRHVGGAYGYDVQRECPAHPNVAVRGSDVRPLEQYGRVLLYCLHPSPVLHIHRQVCMYVCMYVW